MLNLLLEATMGPDHAQISEIARYVDQHVKRVYNVSFLSLEFLFLSRYQSLVQIFFVFRSLQVLDG